MSASFLTVAEVAGLVRRHEVTVRRALESGEMHGRQRVKGGRWTVHVDCATAWAEGSPCSHQLMVAPPQLRLVGGAR